MPSRSQRHVREYNPPDAAGLTTSDVGEPAIPAMPRRPKWTSDISNISTVVDGAMTPVALASSVTGEVSFELGSGTLPEGVTLNAGTGAISGTPTEVGVSTGLSVLAKNAQGGSLSNTFTFTVTAE